MAVNPREVTNPVANKIKWIIWIPWITAIMTCYALAGAALRINPLYMMPTGISVSQPMMFIPYFTVLALIVWLALALGKRGFCHAVCWMAPFLILGTRAGDALGLRKLCLVTRGDECDRCGTCQKHCSMSLPVPDMVATGDMRHPECVLCGECADACPKKVLKLGFAKTRENS